MSTLGLSIQGRNMDTRLLKRHAQLIKSHMNNNDIVSAGIKATLDSNTAFSQTQAAWRFFNNDACTLSELSKPLIEEALAQLPLESEQYGLVAHDWSNIAYNSHASKKDTYKVFKTCIGYQLQSSLLLSDKHGGPLSLLAMNLKNKSELFSSYGNPSRNKSNLEELVERIDWLESQSFEKELVHIVDREGDSVKFFREVEDRNWLLRVKGGNKIRHDNADKKIEAVAKELNYNYSRDVLYKKQPQ